MSAPQTVLFLCTGNYYRSRFAEEFFNWAAGKQNLCWRADSRGLDPDPDNVGPISRHTLEGLRRLGVSFDENLRFPIRAAAADFELAQHVVAIKEAEHRPMIERWFPDWTSRVEFWHVHDLDCAGHLEALAELEQEVLGLVKRLATA